MKAHSISWAKLSVQSLGSAHDVSDSLFLQEIYIHDSLEPSMKQCPQSTMARLTGENEAGNLQRRVQGAGEDCVIKLTTPSLYLSTYQIELGFNVGM